MGAKTSFERGAPVLVKVSDGRGGHTLQSGTVKSTAGKGAVVRFTNGGHERFVFATDISPDTTVATKPKEKVQAPPHFAEKLPAKLPSVGQLFRAERVSRELTIVMVAEACGITAAQLTMIEDGGACPDDDLLLKFSEFVGANLDALVEASTREKGFAKSLGKPALQLSEAGKQLEKDSPPVPGSVTATLLGKPVPLAAWSARLRAMSIAIGRSHDSNIVITHRCGKTDGAWKVEMAGDSAVADSAEEAMSKLTESFSEAVAARIAARRKELAELESLSSTALS